MSKVRYDPNDEPYRFAVHHVNSRAQLPSDFSAKYSEMKYGYPPAIRFMTDVFAAKIASDRIVRKVIKNEGGLLIAGSVYWGVPRGATVLAWEVSRVLIERGIPSENFKINYDGDHNRIRDYAALASDERARILSEFNFWLSEADLRRVAGRTVIVLDDACMTGAHEKRVYEALKDSSAYQTIFGYLINFGKFMARSQPQFEEELNRFGYSNPLDALAELLVEFPEGPELYINARTVRIILSSAEKGRDVLAFYAKLSDSVLLKIYKAAVSKDSYFSQPATMKGFQILQKYLCQKGLRQSLYFPLDSDTDPTYLTILDAEAFA